MMTQLKGAGWAADLDAVPAVLEIEETLTPQARDAIARRIFETWRRAVAWSTGRAGDAGQRVYLLVEPCSSCSELSLLAPAESIGWRCGSRCGLVPLCAGCAALLEGAAECSRCAVG